MSLLGLLRGLIARHRAPRYPTRFGTARIYEKPWGDRRLRVLDVDDSLQSGTFLDDGWCDVPFSYLARYDVIFRQDSPMDRICMLGGGGYAYPKHVVAHHAPTAIDVVEVDPAVTELAREHFFLDRLMREYRTDETGRLNLICADAEEFLESCAREGRTYDAILNDCYMACVADDRLVTSHAADLLHACLRPQGLYLSNVITAMEGPDADVLTWQVGILSESFDHVLAIPSERVRPSQMDNVLVIATDDPSPIEGALRLFSAQR